MPALNLIYVILLEERRRSILLYFHRCFNVGTMGATCSSNLHSSRQAQLNLSIGQLTHTFNNDYESPVKLTAAASVNKNYGSLPNLTKLKVKSKDSDKKQRRRWRLGNSAKQDKSSCIAEVKNDVQPISERSPDMPLMQMLALNALELSVPATDIVLKNRKNNWVQLSGHEGNFSPAGPGTIWKKIVSDDDTEVRSYQKLKNDVMASLVPKFYRHLQYNGDYFIEIQDLLTDFKNPSLLDVKMGTRTFVESEVSNNKLREDLYCKMVAIDRNEPSDEESRHKSITKLRYMLFRESLSSTSNLGFRIEGYKTKNSAATKDIKLVKTREQVCTVISQFLCGKEKHRKEFLKNLLNLRNKFKESTFFSRHEIIGSSLLFIYDDRRCNVYMIDFAKTFEISDSETISHCKPWVNGNHEDGYLIGLDNLISIFETMKLKKH